MIEETHIIINFWNAWFLVLLHSPQQNCTYIYWEKDYQMHALKNLTHIIWTFFSKVLIEPKCFDRTSENVERLKT